MIHSDLGRYRLLKVAGFLEIALQRTQQLIRAYYISLWQSILRFWRAAQKDTSIATTLQASGIFVTLTADRRKEFGTIWSKLLEVSPA